jgi:hypothetical protein
MLYSKGGIPNGRSSSGRLASNVELVVAAMANFSLNKIRVLMMAIGVFEGEKVGVRPAMGMVVERNPNKPFLFKFGLLKLVVLFAAKITWAWPKNKGDAAPYLSMDEFMKYLFIYFVQVFIQHYGGFKDLKSPLVASSSILKLLLPSPCMIMLQCPSHPC